MLQTRVWGFSWDLRASDRAFLETLAGPLDGSFYISLLRFLRAGTPQDRWESIEALLRFMPGMRRLLPSLEICTAEPVPLIHTFTMYPSGCRIRFAGLAGISRVEWSGESAEVIREMAQVLGLPADIWTFRRTSAGQEEYPYLSSTLGRYVHVIFEGYIA